MSGSDSTTGGRFERAIAAIDAANAADPVTIVVDGVERPKEPAHAEMLTRWVQHFRLSAGEALLLAARAHHIRRWEIPRDSYPAGRAGYLRWRRDLHDFHADTTAEILSAVGYDQPTIDRVGELIKKRALGRDPDVQALEDGLCLVFLETQFADLARRTEHARMVDILRRTLRKMSAAGRDAALALDISPAERAILDEALAGRA